MEASPVSPKVNPLLRPYSLPSEHLSQAHTHWWDQCAWPVFPLMWPRKSPLLVPGTGVLPRAAPDTSAHCPLTAPQNHSGLSLCHLVLSQVGKKELTYKAPRDFPTALPASVGVYVALEHFIFYAHLHDCSLHLAPPGSASSGWQNSKARQVLLLSQFASTHYGLCMPGTQPCGLFTHTHSLLPQNNPVIIPTCTHFSRHLNVGTSCIFVDWLTKWMNFRLGDVKQLAEDHG